jgi:competence protein ComEC
MTNKTKYLLLFLTLVASTIWLVVYFYPEKKLRLVVCDVGQGDAILAIYGSNQILVDGGPDRSVLDCISKYMPFWDRSIELVILTHPQKDHFGGLIDVFRRYKVGHFVANNINSGGQEYEVLKKLVGGMNAAVHNPTSDMQMRLGLMYLEVVWPTDEFLTENTSTKELAGGINLELNEEGGVLGEATTSRDPNDFSVVTVLRLGEFDALLTGDIQPPVINRVVEIIGESYIKEYEYIKVPHHGSKNGLIKELLEITDPQIAVISVGRKNRYGHPHQETLEILGYRDIRILRTDKDGDVEIVSDGKEWWIGD